MMTRRSVGKTRVAKSLWYAKKGVAELRAAPLPTPGPGQARVRTLFSGISRGTERLGIQRRRRPKRVGAHARTDAGRVVPLPGQIRLLRDRGCRGGAGGPARKDGLLPASAPGLFQRPRGRPGGGAGCRPGQAGHPGRQYGNGPQRPLGRRRRPWRPHRRGGRRRGGAAGGLPGRQAARRHGHGRRRGSVPQANPRSPGRRSGIPRPRPWRGRHRLPRQRQRRRLEHRHRLRRPGRHHRRDELVRGQARRPSIWAAPSTAAG